jgi:hypothetical protein
MCVSRVQAEAARARWRGTTAVAARTRRPPGTPIVLPADVTAAARQRRADHDAAARKLLADTIRDMNTRPTTHAPQQPTAGRPPLTAAQRSTILAAHRRWLIHDLGAEAAEAAATLRRTVDE